MTATCDRGTVLKIPDLLGDHDYQPYVCLKDDSHRFSDEELYEILTEFIGDGLKASLDRIDPDANESNLNRFDFALMMLLCAGHSYEDIAR